ncbi:MAG: DUF6163 family protein [Cohaesibacteraceae bacterium]
MAPSTRPQPISPIRVTPEKNARLEPVERWLLVVLRVIGLLLILRALFGWFILVGMTQFEEGLAVEQLTSFEMSLFIVMSLVAVIAGVGLWLLAAWGAVLWLALVAVDAILFFVAPHLPFSSLLVVLMNAGLIMVYLGMVLQVRRLVRSARTL